MVFKVCSETKPVGLVKLLLKDFDDFGQSDYFVIEIRLTKRCNIEFWKLKETLKKI